MSMKSVRLPSNWIYSKSSLQRKRKSEKLSLFTMRASESWLVRKEVKGLNIRSLNSSALLVNLTNIFRRSTSRASLFGSLTILSISISYSSREFSLNLNILSMDWPVSRQSLRVKIHRILARVTLINQTTLNLICGITGSARFSTKTTLDPAT